MSLGHTVWLGLDLQFYSLLVLSIGQYTGWVAKDVIGLAYVMCYTVCILILYAKPMTAFVTHPVEMAVTVKVKGSYDVSWRNSQSN